jgi:glucokinase
MSEFAIGIDLGGTNLKAALVQRDQGIVQRSATPTEADRGPDHVVDRIAAAVHDMIETAPDSEIAGVGIGSPGTIDWERTTISQPPNFPGWKQVNLQTALRERLPDRFDDLAVFVENDANVAGLGSAHYGTGRPYDSFLMITLGTGVGGAIIYQNRIFRGATGAAGEIGHMTINYAGPFENFGIGGAIEGYVGQKFLSHHARLRLRSQTDSLVHDLTDDDLEGLSPKVLFEAAEAGDGPARDMLAWAGHKLGVVLGSAVNLLDIRTIVVGGGVSAAGSFILDPARETLQEFTIPNLRDGLQLLREERGNEVGLLGAAHLAFDGEATQVGD